VGNIGGLYRAVDWFRAEAGDLGQATTQLDEAKSSSTDKWKGNTADAFRNKIGDIPDKLGILKTRFENIATALEGFAQPLHDAQVKAKNALSTATTIRGDMRGRCRGGLLPASGARSAAGPASRPGDEGRTRQAVPPDRRPEDGELVGYGRAGQRVAVEAPAALAATPAGLAVLDADGVAQLDVPASFDPDRVSSFAGAHGLATRDGPAGPARRRPRVRPALTATQLSMLAIVLALVVAGLPATLLAAVWWDRLPALVFPLHLALVLAAAGAAPWLLLRRAGRSG
jgi:hypothetical protein